MALDDLAPENAPDTPTKIELTFQGGDIIAIDGQPLSPATVLAELNRIGGANGIGRLDLVENRYVGMKSRGCYETPGGTIMLKAHRAMESLTLDREVAHLKDELMPRYAQLVYNGFWWSPERHMLQTAIDHSQARVNGTVRLKLYRGGGDRYRAALRRQPVRRGSGHVRRRPGRLSPGRRRGVHQAPRPAAAHPGPAEMRAGTV